MVSSWLAVTVACIFLVFDDVDHLRMAQRFPVTTLDWSWSDVFSRVDRGNGEAHGFEPVSFLVADI
jgi:hypothetical protein